MLKNSLKIFLGNIGTGWKVLVYKALIALCALGLTTAIMMPVVNALYKANYFAEVSKLVNELSFTFSLQNLLLGLVSLFEKMWSILNSANLIVFIVIVGIVLFCVYYYISGLYKLALAESIYTYMTSNAKIGFMSCFVGKLKKSLVYGLFRLITSLVMDIIIFTVCILTFNGLKSSLALATLMVLILIVFLCSLKNTVLCGWETAICVHDCSCLEALKKSFKTCIKKFFKIWSDNAFIILFALAINVFMIFATMGIGLIVTIPLSCVLVSCYNGVAYFESRGMRYYLDSNNIFSPRKLEAQDKISKVKDII